MGDSFQALAVSEAESKKASHLAAEISEWLLAKGIVRRDMPIGTSKGRLAPGPNADRAIDTHKPEEARWRDLVYTDVEIDAKRTVSSAVQGGAGPVFCPLCDGAVGNQDNATDAFMSAVAAWHQGSDGALLCPHCQVATLITTWRTEPYWAFSTLTVTFWNWPRLAPAFVDEFSATTGHPIKIVRGRI
jgi:hypothetical protein